MCWARLEAPPLYYMPYKDIGFASYITKSEIENSLQIMMNQLYGVGFVDMGDISDLMHGHMLLATNKDTFQKEPVAVLYHSQEYPHFRKGKPYATAEGEIHGLDRNWVLFLKDQSGYKRGDVVDANTLMTKKLDKKKLTVYSKDLDPKIMGKDMIEDESYYFFRTECSAVKSLNLNSQDNVVVINNNFIQEQVCLALLSYQCRNTIKGHNCETKTPLPSYDILKDNKSLSIVELAASANE